MGSDDSERPDTLLAALAFATAIGILVIGSDMNKLVALVPLTFALIFAISARRRTR